jgi:ribonucleoside-diphosphate reductase alpha chain
MTSPASGIDSAPDGYGEPRLTENARSVLEARYLKKNEAGECIETPGALFRRVARTIADAESRYGASEAQRQDWERAFYQLMASGDFMPNSPTLMNAGREMGMLSACFVLPVRDSIIDIFNSIKHTALIQKAGGGTGFAFDELRPTGDYIKSSGGTTSGPISFWRAFSEATNAIQQGAFRRGANMGMMYIHHPDILKFLHAKQDLEQFTNYNISVKITDAWMEDFLQDPDSPHVVRNPRTGNASVLPRDLKIWEYDVRGLVEIDCVEPVPLGNGAAYYTSPRLTGELPAELRGKVYTKRDIWDIIVKNAWQTGEPGVVFIDRINEHNPTPHLGRIEATNPCGEQPLLPYEACNLGSINLGNFVRNPCSPEAEVDWEALRRAIHLSTRFLDNVIDANSYPLPEIENMCKANRKVGLGIMGFADALYKLGVAYNSDEGIAWGARFMRFVNDEAHDYSEHLARVRGCFPNWQGSIWQTKHNRLMRNAATTTAAPTGTISIIANCSAGIEPLFSLAFIRNVLRGQRHRDEPLFEINETFHRVAEQRGLASDRLFEQLAREGTLRHIADVPQEIKKVFVCAHDITPEWHMRMQAAFQQHCDSSISKTINFPRNASPADVEKIYRLAFDLRCKGVTVYRDGCRRSQPMALKNDEQEGKEAEATAAETAAVAAGQSRDPAAAPPASRRGSGNGNRNRRAGPVRPTPGERGPVGTVIPVPPRIEPQDLPEIVSGLRIRQLTPFGNMHVKITVDPRSDRELEVFAQLGKGGDLATSDLEAICRMISLWLRSGGSLRHVIKQLAGIGSSLQIPTRAGRIMSLGDGLAAALKKYMRAKERFGLRSLLLGEIDLSELDSPHSPPHTPDRAPSDRTLQSEQAAPSTNRDDRKSSDGGTLRSRASAQLQPEADRIRPEASHALAERGDDPCAAKYVAGALCGPPRTEHLSVATAVAELPQTEALVRDDVARVTESPPVTSVRPVATKVIIGDDDPVRPALAGGENVRQPDMTAHYKLKCPECGGALVMQEACCKCHGCGWAAC